MSHTARIVLTLLCAAVITAGCAGPTPTPDEPTLDNESLTRLAVDEATAFASMSAVTPGPSPTPTAGPSPTASLPPVAPLACSGTMAYVMGNGKAGELHMVDGCGATALLLPDDADPPIDFWVVCDPNATLPDLMWSPDGKSLVYATDYYYSGHGEVHVLKADTRSVFALTPSYTMLDADSGKVVKPNCADPAACHPGVIKDGQITFINSRNPRWSPDGTEILFESMIFDTANQNQPAFRSFRMAAGGGKIRALTDDEAAALTAQWGKPSASPANFNPQISDPSVKVGCAVWQP